MCYASDKTNRIRTYRETLSTTNKDQAQRVQQDQPCLLCPRSAAQVVFFALGGFSDTAAPAALAAWVTAVGHCVCMFEDGRSLSTLLTLGFPGRAGQSFVLFPAGSFDLTLTFHLTGVFPLLSGNTHRLTPSR
jgi:hypothetical protein